MPVIQLASASEESLTSRLAREAGDTVLTRQMFAAWGRESWRPAVNLYETRQAFLICVDLAGIHERDVDVRLENGRIIIRGKRDCPMPTGEERAIAVHQLEIDHGVFSRAVELPDNVDDGKISAIYEAGLLWITLPKHHK